jgi:nucleotide-binding universal stress UspA family protein
MQTIVVGYDGSEDAGRALERSVEIARAFSARLIVVSVAELPPTPPVYAFGAPAGLAAPVLHETPLADVAPEEIVARALAEARARVEGVEAEFEARSGDAGNALIAVADERGADLLVVGTREPGFLTRLLEGSVSSDLTRRAHCDVLVVHPEHGRRD